MENNNLPYVSIIIPCRNDKKYISAIIDSILENDWPKDKLEILVVDGASIDGTKEIIKKYAVKNNIIKVFDSPKKFTCFALNIGVKNSKGDIIGIIAAHSKTGKDFISKSVKYLNEYNADCVGGLKKIINSNDSLISNAITIASSSVFSAGNTKFELNPKRVEEADTAFRPFYKKEVFAKIGFFNENLKRSQDIEFNLRLKRAGGKIIIAPDIASYYFQKHNFWNFFVHNFNDGVWAIYPFKFIKIPLKLRHYIPFLFVLAIIISGILGIFYAPALLVFSGIVILYILTNLLFSFFISLQKGFKYFFVLPFVFINRHFGYGLGSLWGFIKLCPVEKFRFLLPFKKLKKIEK